MGQSSIQKHTRESLEEIAREQDPDYQEGRREDIATAAAFGIIIATGILINSLGGCDMPHVRLQHPAKSPLLKPDSSNTR